MRKRLGMQKIAPGFSLVHGVYLFSLPEDKRGQCGSNTGKAGEKWEDFYTFKEARQTR